MNRNPYLPAILILCAAASAAMAVPRDVHDELIQEILKRVPEWPGTEVEIPSSLYYQFVRESVLGPVPPQPPEPAWLERAAWTVRIGEKESEVAVVFDVVRLPGAAARTLALLPTALVWRDVTLDGRKVDLRRADDGWFHFDAPDTGRFRIAAKATVKPTGSGDTFRFSCAIPKSVWTTASAESDAAWEVRFAGAALPVVGGPEGTRGTVGLVPRVRLDATWQRPQPPVRRAARIAVESHVGWTLADGVHQVRAVLDLRLWGGEAEDLVLALPPGADRVSITGGDVREVQVQGSEARVFLRGAITQRTRLAVAFESPRPPTGRMTLPAIGVAGATYRGGTLAIAGGAGGVILEMDSPNLVPMALRDLPDDTRGLLTAPPVYAYTLGGGPWEARVDLVGMSEFPVRETLIDSALYTVLYRPDGHVMTKVIYEVRNRGQQYMRVDLPAGARLVVARVSEQQKNLARGPDSAVYVPLEKSVLTTAGLVSFPVELVYVMAAPRLGRQGTLRLPLPRTDLPVAYARCALAVPDGLTVREWQGTLRHVSTWSSETAEMEFEYGTGHLAKGLAPKPKEEPSEPKKAPPKPAEKPKGPGILDGGLVRLGAAFIPDRDGDKPRQEPETRLAAEDERSRVQGQILQSKNYYRAGVDAYQRGDYRKSQELLSRVVEVAPNSTEAENARKYLGNVDVALGKDAGGDKGDRSLKATAKMVRQSQQFGNVEVVAEQQELLQQAEQSLRAGNEAQAEAAYKVAVGLAEKLQTRGESGREQEAVVRKAKEFLEKRDQQRTEQDQKLLALQREVQSLKAGIAQKGGKEAEALVEALDMTDQPTLADAPVMGSLFADGTVVRGRAAARGGPAPAARPTAGGTAGRPPGAVAAGESTTGSPTPPVPILRRPPVAIVAGAASNRLVLREESIERARPDGAALGVLPPAAPSPPQPSQSMPQVELGEALARQQVTLGGKISGGQGGGGGGGGGQFGYAAGAGGQLERLKLTVEQLKFLHRTLATDTDDAASGYVTLYSGQAVHVKRPAGEDGTTTTVSQLGRQLAEKAENLAAQSKEVTELARQGRLVEAEQLAANIERQTEVTRRAAQALTKTGSGTVVGWDERAGRPVTAAVSATPPPAPPEPRAPRVPDFGGAAPRFEAGDVIATARPPELRTHLEAQPPAADRRYVQMDLRPQVAADLWARASDARQTGRFDDALAAVNGILAASPQDERARRWRDDLLYLQGQSRQATAAPAGRSGAVDVLTDTEQAAREPAGLGTVVLGYGENKDYENLTHFRTLDRTRDDLAKARELLKAQAAQLDKVQINVRDLTEDVDGDRRLAEFVVSNYQWGLRGPAARPGAAPQDVAATSAGVVNLNTASQVTLQVAGGNLVVPNDPGAVGQVQAVLDRLRANLGQRVQVGSRNIFVGDTGARTAGIEWKDGASGVRYSVINEGQLLSLMDIEQRRAGGGLAAILPRDARQDAVVGTGALLANGGVIAVARAGDAANGFSYVGNDVEVAHDDYLLVSNGAYLTAVKSGRMQHWSVEVEPVRFPGVPAEVVVPVVGRTVKFEKTLLDPSDTLELVTDYTWQGDER